MLDLKTAQLFGTTQDLAEHLHKLSVLTFLWDVVVSQPLPQVVACAI